WFIAAGAIVGGVITAFVVYILSWRNGVQGFRLIVVGIGVSAMLTSINSYLITRADVDDAMMVGFWSAGSINRVTWGSLTPSVAIFVVIFGLALVFASALHHMDSSDDTALTDGFMVGPADPVLIVVGVATTWLVTAAAGPIGFVALAAPQLARRITSSPGVSVVSSAAMGAALLAIALLLSFIIATFCCPIPVG